MNTWRAPKIGEIEKKMAGTSASQGERSHGGAINLPLSYLGGNGKNKREHSSERSGSKPTIYGALERQKSRSCTPGGTRKPTTAPKTAPPPTPGAAPRTLPTASASRPSSSRFSASKKTDPTDEPKKKEARVQS